jgi:hypothetical protein
MGTPTPNLKLLSTPKDGDSTPMASPVTRRHFSETFPNGVELSQDTIDLLESRRKERTAMAFDEVTLEDKPSNYHPNQVDVRSYITRKLRLKACGIMSAAMVTILVPTLCYLCP